MVCDGNRFARGTSQTDGQENGDYHSARANLWWRGICFSGNVGRQHLRNLERTTSMNTKSVVAFLSLTLCSASSARAETLEWIRQLGTSES